MLSVLLIWSFLVLFVQLRYALLDKFHVPLNSLSLVSTFVAALQTLRSNQGLSRLKEGRLAGGKMVLLTRDTALLFATYVYPKDKNLGLLAGESTSLIFVYLLLYFTSLIYDRVISFSSCSRSIRLVVQGAPT